VPDIPSMRSYSFQGQDRFVIRVLHGKRHGFFLDIGASDGVDGSNTKLLEEDFEWTGICVEPNNEFYADLCRNRRCACVNCCLFDRGGSVEFLEGARHFGGIISAYSPVHRRIAEQAAHVLGRAEQSRIGKLARTPLSVLLEYGAPPVIDYLSLDTEGSELRILKAFPFDRYSVRVLTVEHNFLHDRDPIRQHLHGLGYERVHALGIDDGYVARQELGPPLRPSNAIGRRRPTRPTS
jgi:FkbM family methyltransferase